MNDFAIQEANIELGKRINDYRISLLIPTFNSEATLDKALKSIREQDFQKVEVILIDGGSTDSTLRIAESSRDLISVVVSEPDNGIYDAINKGIDLASGALVCVLGSDDELLPRALENVFANWVLTKADVVSGRALMISEDGSEVLREDEDFGAGSQLSGIPFCHNAMFVTREAYRLVGYYDLRYRICADADWVHRAIRSGCTCSQIEVPVVRFSLGGLSSNNPEDIMRETYEVVASNFPGLSLEDAERLFRAVRGWSDGSDVESVLRRYPHHPDLMIAAVAAFRARARRLATAAPALAVNPPPSSMWTAFSRRFQQILK